MIPTTSVAAVTNNNYNTIPKLFLDDLALSFLYILDNVIFIEKSLNLNDKFIFGCFCVCGTSLTFITMINICIAFYIKIASSI